MWGFRLYREIILTSSVTRFLFFFFLQVHAPSRIKTDSVDAFMQETRATKRISMRIIQVCCFATVPSEVDEDGKETQVETTRLYRLVVLLLLVLLLACFFLFRRRDRGRI